MNGRAAARPPLEIDTFQREAGLEFDLDPFQVQAIEALRGGRSVLVAAPTGAGKTLIAEYAVREALREGVKVFYTTPVKALSNQKYHDLVRLHGANDVGLLTGDNAVNAEAPIVVMTTEVLRNMVHTGSSTLTGMRYVVLDEVHYLQDAYRGPVWEEVIIHLPPAARLVCLSATVSNAEDLADWIASVRGPTDVVVETERPVELENLYLVDDRANRSLRLTPTLVDGRPNPDGARFDADLKTPGRGRRRRWATPRRLDTLEELDRRGMLPSIHFIFSRAGCDDAAASVRDAGVRLTSETERARIGQVLDERTEMLSDADLEVLGYDRFRAGLEAGVAAHHAGMVPPFKEAVEECFQEGLVKVVFATETLALGINMPARSVVIDNLSKFNGETHELLQPGQYTQITGRAGRRGIDDHGYAVVLWSPFVSFDRVAALAASRSFELRSAFRPTYNMAANLVQRYEPEEAHRLLNLSFAQYTADREVVRLEHRAGQQRSALDELRVAATCDRGDVEEYARRREAGRGSPSPRRRIEEALERLRPGDVIALDDGEACAVLTVGQRGKGTRIRVVTGAGHRANRGAADFRGVPRVIEHLDLPTPFAPTENDYQRRVARLLADLAAPVTSSTEEPHAVQGFEAHPVHACEDRDRHLAARRRMRRHEREIERLDRQVTSRRDLLVRQFDHVLEVLEHRGHLDGWALTERGETLARTYHESDLLVAEAMHDQLLDDLGPPELAALASCLTYEHRSSTPAPEPVYPTRAVRERALRLDRLARDLAGDEQRWSLEPTRPPDHGFMNVAHAWASGGDLDQVLEGEDLLTGGDFVRNIRQLLDLLRQVGETAPEADTRRAARRAASELHRGVVSASSLDL